MRPYIALRNAFCLALFGTVLLGCVEHRPVRNGLDDTHVYLAKEEMTALNPKTLATKDDGWLYKVTIVKTSSPNVVADYAFPGLESDTRYVRFRFAENALQILDGRSLQEDDPDNPNDDLATRTDLVITEFTGEHVDVKLRESLDGERTNWLEENKEEPWQKRQKFRVDFEKTTMDPIASLAWFYGDYLHDCASQDSVHLVPGSFEWDSDDQYMSWVLEVNYSLNAATLWGGCWDMLSLNQNVGTATIQYRFSFYRPGPSDFPEDVIAEKHPVNKKYGAFQVLNMFRDAETGILGGESLLQRWDPNRGFVDFYFHEGFPNRFKPMFSKIAKHTNDVLKEAGAKLRFRFVDHDHDGKIRHFGDLRYSFVVWHQDIDTTRGLLGYGPSSSDPRTGEVLSANLNLYNIGMDYYRYLIETYLEDHGGLSKPDPDLPWEQITCEPDETTAPILDGELDTNGRLQTQLFQQMRRVLEIEERTSGSITDFVPTPTRGEAFAEDYHRLLPELRFAEPSWNQYVGHRTFSSGLANFAERRAIESEFQEAMFEIAMNNNPFGPLALYGREGIEAQLELLENLRLWRRNHDELRMDEDRLFASRNVYLLNPTDAIGAISRSARQCVDGHWESTEDYSERIIYNVVRQVAIHEFGHNLALRHNFYGSVDAKHTHEGQISSSVMDYVASWEEAADDLAWGPYDKTALKWIYGDDALRTALMEEDFLYCTDQHRTRSPLCTAHDLGITPSQIVINAIERYDWLYKLRNKRAYRTFWDTSSYASRVYSALFPLQRMWHLLMFDWGGGGVEETLKRLDQLDPERPVLTQQAYNEIAQDFYNDSARSVSLIMAFYDAIINQSAAFRNYQTEFDPYYGDILRMGIIVDKLFATIGFMDLQEIYHYDPNVVTYLSLYDMPYSAENLAVSQRVLDNMLGGNYDTFIWFRHYALNIFAAVTNTNLIRSAELKERIAIQRFDTLEAFEEIYGTEAVPASFEEGNSSQIFVHDGKSYAYTYLADRSWHLVANSSRNPVSYNFLVDYNEALRGGASESLDTYNLKILLAYYEYFNNFQGF